MLGQIEEIWGLILRQLLGQIWTDVGADVWAKLKAKQKSEF
jgi:hypothetical protein